MLDAGAAQAVGQGAVMDWKTHVAAISPLFSFAEHGTWGGEGGVLRRIFQSLPARARFGVEFGQRTIGTGTLAGLLRSRGWGALYMDVEATAERQTRVSGPGQSITLVREKVLPSTINALFEKHGVPEDLDVLVIDIDSLDYWVWQALSARWAPSLVVIEYNAHVPWGVQASIAPDEGWSYQRTRDYGASFEALRGLAAGKGYRLIHVHGPWNLYFLKNDIDFPTELCIKPDLTADDFPVLTDTEAFYDAYCGDAKRPSWFDAPPPDVSRAPWQLLAPPSKTSRVEIAGLRVEVLADKHDLTWYQQRKVFEESVSPMYRFLREEGFGRFVDVGANVGFISMLALRAVPGVEIIAIEADPTLAALIRANFAANALVGPTLVNAVVGERSLTSTGFSLNPNSSLDNRVVMAKWAQVRLPMISLDDLLANQAPVGRTFIKIDTQGFELPILRGLEQFLSGEDGWLLKMEFAPDWLRSQGHDPLAVLDHLQQRYEFAEFPERITFDTPGFDALFTTIIAAHRHADFLAYVVSLNKGGKGWVDLIVRPRPPRAPS